MNELNVNDFGSNHLRGSNLHLNDLGVGDWSSNELQLANWGPTHLNSIYYSMNPNGTKCHF